MSFLKTILRSICWSIGKIIAYALIGSLIFFIFGKLTNAQELGRVFYNGVQQGSTFTFNNVDDVAQWTNTNANTIRYDNSNITMISGTTYTFSTRFTILLQDDIDTTTSIQAIPGYSRNGKVYNFSNTTCNISYQSKVLSSTTTKKTVENYITITCPDITFSTGNNSFNVRFAISNNDKYYNIIEMSRSGLVFKDNSKLTESDKITINANQNAQDIINNQNQNQQQTNDRLDDFKDFFTDDNVDSSNFNFNVDIDDSPISSFLTMPIKFIQLFNNYGTCSPIEMPSFFGNYDHTGKTYLLPCYQVTNVFPSNLANLIDVIFCVFSTIGIAELFIYVFNQFKNLNDLYDEYYTPKHTPAGYKPRHGGDSQ